MNKMLDYAIEYVEKYNFALIPLHEPKDGGCSCSDGKKCRHVGKHPRLMGGQNNWSRDIDQIRKWWDEWPSANIGLVTGDASNGLAVVDIDSAEGFENISTLIPKGMEYPIAQTAGEGRREHWFFRTDEKLKDRIGRIVGTDFRNNGIIVLVPSVGSTGKKYKWVKSLDKYEIPELPEAYIEAVRASQYESLQVSVSHAQQESSYGEEHSLPQGNETPTKQLSSLVNIDTKLQSKVSKSIGYDDKNGTEYFAEGRRDNDLFSVANAMVKAGLDPVLGEQTLTRIVLTWGEHDPAWVKKKVVSAMKRHGHDNLAYDIRQYVMLTSGIFTSSDVSRELCLSSRNDKKNLSKTLSRLVDDEVIERVGKIHGQFRRIEKEREIFDWKSVDPFNFYDLKMPLGIHDMCNINKTNIVVIAGDSNAGKTAFALNVAKMNSDKKVRYINSEMDETEIAQRIALFDAPKSDWDHVEFSRLKGDGADDIGPDDLNIIDYIEPEEYWQMPKVISAIHERLKGGICVICLQKKPNEIYGKGGSGTVERCRLYISMEYQKLKFVKVKSPKNGRNMKDMEIHFKLHNHSTFYEQERH